MNSIIACPHVLCIIYRTGENSPIHTIYLSIMRYYVRNKVAMMLCRQCKSSHGQSVHRKLPDSSSYYAHVLLLLRDTRVVVVFFS